MSAHRMPVTLVVALALAAAPAASRAQVGLPVSGEHPSLHIEVTKPFFDDPGPFGGARIATSLWDASVVVPLEGGPTLFGRLGLAFGLIDGQSASATVSKPRFGVLVSPRGGLALEAHLDLPFVLETGEENYATGMGLFADHEEFERFADDAWSFGAAATAERALDPGAFVGFRAGGTLLVPTGDSGETDLFAVYAVFGHLPAGERTRLHLEVSGTALLTEPGLSGSDRTTFFATIMLSRPTSRFSPALYVRAPVDEAVEGVVNFVVGVRSTVGG
jgi:hypothetical protein